jgi:hypothetical protein
MPGVAPIGNSSAYDNPRGDCHGDSFAAGRNMPVSVMQFWILSGDRAAGMLRLSVVIGRLAMLVALSWVMFASATVTASYSCSARENGARLVGERSISAVHKSVPAAHASRAIVGNMDCDRGAPGSGHRGDWTGTGCSTCLHALGVAAAPLFELSEARIDFVVLQERPRPVDPLPELRPPIPFA